MSDRREDHEERAARERAIEAAKNPRITLTVSTENEGTDSPYWLILDPAQNMQMNVDLLAAQITGPFFSREEAQAHLDSRSYAFSKRAVVYCKSGYRATQYREAYRKVKR